MRIMETQARSPLAGALVALLMTMITGCTNMPAAPDLFPAAKAELAPTGALRVAVFTGNPVIGAKDKATSSLTGTTVDLGRTLAREMDVPVTFIEYTAVAKMVDDAKIGAWDIAVVAYDPARLGVLDFAPSHITVDLTYLVAPGSAIRSVGDADQPGVKIAAARGAATALYLERTLKQAAIVPADSEPAAFNLIKDGRAQAYAQNRYMLIGLAEGLPGARVLDDRFAVAEMCIVLPKGRPAALEYVATFVSSAKKSGVVSRAIEAAGLRGVAVAQVTQ
jgi:polar amino acid transport system substrate-binding protein